MQNDFKLNKHLELNLCLQTINFYNKKKTVKHATVCLYMFVQDSIFSLHIFLFQVETIFLLPYYYNVP